MNSSTNTLTKFTYDTIKDIYISGCKAKSDLKVGLEYERLPVDVTNYEAVSYWGETGVCELLRAFARQENWDYILDSNEIIGLKQGHDTITLEPGCQLEFSIEPQKDIFMLETKVKDIDNLMSNLLNKMGIKLLKYGVYPLSTYKNIKLIPKKRYEIMAKYLWGILSDVMMRETAGIQGTFDFTSEEDAMRKFKIANMLSPFVTAMFANSPIRGGVDTGYKSFRALSWLNTDNDRCGFFTKFEDESSFDDYIKRVLETPMLFINRHDDSIVISGDKTFSDFMKYGHVGFEPRLEDYLLQANLCFPEVRLRNFVEIRNHDCGNSKAAYAILALYKGILYSETAMTETEELFKNLKAKDYAELRYKVPAYTLNAEIGNFLVKDFAREILNIASSGLKNVNKNELHYLDYIKEYTHAGITPADVILRNWYGCWNKNFDKFIAHIS